MFMMIDDGICLGRDSFFRSLAEQEKRAGKGEIESYMILCYIYAVPFNGLALLQVLCKSVVEHPSGKSEG